MLGNQRHHDQCLLAGCGRTPPVAQHASFASTLRCESSLWFTTASFPRLDWPQKPRTSLGPGFFRNLLEPGRARSGVISQAIVRLVFGMSVLGMIGLAACRDAGPSDVDPARASEAELATVLFIVLDTIRADHLSLCGYSRPTTPHLDRLAESPGASWTCDAHAPGSWTLPSHASFFTGLEVPDHRAAILPRGVIIGGNMAVPLSTEWPTLAGEMSDRGYQTFSFSSNPVIDHSSGLVAGFEVWHAADRFGQLSTDAFTRALRTLLDTKQDRTRPLFLFLNISDAHAPYSLIPAGIPWLPQRGPLADPNFPGTGGNRFVRGELSPRDAKRYAAHYRDSYDHGVFQADRVLAEALSMLKETNRLDGNYRIILTSDHGEFLTERGLVGHDSYLFEENSRVPLVYVRGNGNALALPRLINATSVHALVLGDSLPEPSLPVRAVGYPNVAKQITFGRSDLYHELFVALWQDHYKWLWTNETIVRYDLETDPHEMRPTNASPSDLPTELRELVQSAMIARRSADDESEELNKKLKALGYAR